MMIFEWGTISGTLLRRRGTCPNQVSGGHADGGRRYVARERAKTYGRLLQLIWRSEVSRLSL